MTNSSQDKRVSRVFASAAGAVGSVFVLALGWIGSTLMEVRESAATIKVQIAPSTARMDRIEEKVENVQTQMGRIEMKVATMEARQQQVMGE